MIHELSLFLCRDEESGKAYFAVREEDGSLSYVEPETLLSVKMAGSGPFPVMLKADDLKVEQDMKKLYGRHQACGAHKKVLTLRDASGTALRFSKPVENSRFPFILAVMGEDGEETVRQYSPLGYSSSGNPAEDIVDYSIDNK